MVYMDGFFETIPVRYGVNILEADWLQSPTPRSLAYEAQLAARADGKANFAFEWVNPRFGFAIREIRLPAASHENPVTLSGLSMVERRIAPEPKPLRLAQ